MDTIKVTSETVPKVDYVNPNEHQFNISEELIKKLKEYLIGDAIFFLKDEDLHSKDDERSFEHYKTIYFDAERTRVLQTKEFPNFKSDLKCILLYYCIKNDIPYKQGLNEVLAPFLILHCKYPHCLSLVEVYQMFRVFINQYIVNFVAEKNFQTFRQSLHFFQILFRYHNPSLYAFFENLSIVPEMYSLSWLLTIFSSKVKLDIVYRLWSYFIPLKDSLFPYYLLVALFQQKTKELIQEDSIRVIGLLCSITITSFEQLDLLIERANQIKDNTPYSFKLMIDKLGLFNPRHPFINEKENKIAIPLMPILSSELCYFSRPDIFKCPNVSCSHSSKYGNLNLITNQKGTDCWICGNPKFENKETNDSYIILDIRDSRQLEGCGLMTKSIFINDDFLNDKEKEISICKMLSNEKGRLKFIILVSKTDLIEFFEKESTNDYKKDGLNPSRSTIFQQTRSSLKQRNSLDPQKDDYLNLFQFTSSKSKRYNEYIKFKKLIDLLIKNEFPYISYCSEGFEAIHRLFLQHNIPIVLHVYSKCLFCNNRSKSKLGKSFSMQKNGMEIIDDIIGNRGKKNRNPHGMAESVTMNEISDIISSNKYQVYFGILIEYQNKKDSKNSQLFICLNNNDLTIYKKVSDKVHSEILTLLISIKIEQIASARRDANTKNILQLLIFKEPTLVHQSSNSQTTGIMIDFSNKEESRRFLVDLKDYGRMRSKK